MKKINTILGVVSGILLLGAMSSCTVSTGAAGVGNTVVLSHKENPQQRFDNIVYGIRLVVTNEAPAFANFSPSVESFVKESMKRYMRQMGFQMDVNSSTDYVMNITVKQFEDHRTSMEITIYDPSHTEVYSSATSAYAATINYYNKPYANALEKIDWESIAYLVQQRRLPEQEQTAQVKGQGNTALEHTILNWEVTSRPAGADLYWRVISSTPDVKNTNKNYKATTPYESTESFDIRGLTYQNSGDVQIELTCEKPGYLTQKKVFNVRMALDQKSINAHFSLVKDE